MRKCPHCNKDVEDGLTSCPHCQKALAATQPDPLESIKAAMTQIIAPIADAVKALSEKVAKIEAMPAVKNFNVITGPSTEKYLGYKVAEQGEALREKFSREPNRFKTLSDDSKMNDFVKFMLDVKGALTGNITCQQKLQDAAQKATDMSEGTDAVGGYAVPIEYQNDLIKLVRDNSFALQKCTVVNMSKQTLKLPAEASMVSVGWEDEAASIDASNPTFGQVTLTAKKLTGMTSGISGELLADSAVDIVSLLTEQFMYAIGQELDNKVLNGTGAPWSGVLTAAAGYSTVMTLANFSSITADDLSKMIYQLAEADAAVAEFIFNRLIMHYIRILKESGTGAYIWQKPGDGKPGSIWEVPYFQSIKGPGTTGTSTAFVALGNWKYFYLGRRLGVMAFASDPYTNFATDQVRFRAITRWGGSIARATAFSRLLTGS
jgi:HK97 family phage major capsid protein